MENQRKISKSRSRWQMIKKLFSILFVAFTLLTALMYWSEHMLYSDDRERSPLYACGWDDSIGIVTLYGQIDTFNSGEWVTSSDEIVNLIELLDREPQFDTIVLLIDSGGGYGVAAEEISNALKDTSKFSIAVIREMGTSAAYSAATGADIIYASESSHVGGLGVTMSYLDYSEYYEDEGVQYRDLTSARFKNVGDPRRSLDEEEEAYLESLLEKSHELMVKNIKENRVISSEEIEAVADGKMILGIDALEYGLIDKIGGLREAIRNLGRDMEDTCKVSYQRH